MPIDSQLGAFAPFQHSASTRTQSNGIEAWTEQVTQFLSATPISAAQSARGKVASLAIPLDEHRLLKQANAEIAPNADISYAASQTRREPLRRDSLKRREALLKGNEGSRRRQRWENDRLLNNPWAQPPLPSDWEVHPTYPKHNVPYYLAPLWDANLPQRQEAERKRRAAMKKHVEGQSETHGKVPKELREKLKKAKAAKGLLQVLEEEVRKFIKTWEEKTQVKENEVVPEVDSEDEEIVFIGRNGYMPDMPPSPEASYFFVEKEIQTDRLIFDSMADDHGASFGRWLVHSIGNYYGLRTWSVTVGDPARREAYVGINPTKCATPDCPTFALPRPLWGMV